MKGGKTYRNELQDFIHEHYWRAQPQNGLPFDPVQWSNRKYRLQPNSVKKIISSDTITHGEEGNVENGEVQGHAQRNSRHEELVLPKWQAKQAFVLGQRVHRVEHFDRDQNRQAHRGRMSRLDAREHIAPDFRKERRTLVEVRLMDYQTPSFANRRARQKIRTN